MQNFILMGILTLIVKKKNILGIIINNAFLFDSYIKEVLKKATQKLTALSYSTNHLELEER